MAEAPLEKGSDAGNKSQFVCPSSPSEVSDVWVCLGLMDMHDEASIDRRKHR